MRDHLFDVPTCPYCGRASPTLTKLWGSGTITGSDKRTGRRWATYSCATCGGVLIAEGVRGDGNTTPKIENILPATPRAHDDLPASARIYLDQAYASRAAPDAATMVSASAIDAMLKAKGYAEGALYSRIQQARTDGLLTAAMAEWAHVVRLEANRTRHADSAQPHVTAEQAAEVIRFAEALGDFLFIIPARIARGISAANQAGGAQG